jgi:predicted dehydrogenase
MPAEIAGVTATLLEFESGLRGYLGSSYVTRFAHWINIYGTRKNAFFSELGGLQLTDDSWEDGEVREQIAPAAELGAPMPTIIEEIREFAHCIRTGEPPEIRGEDGLHNLAVVLAAVESNRTGAPVEVASVREKAGI